MQPGGMRNKERTTKKSLNVFFVHAADRHFPHDRIEREPFDGVQAWRVRPLLVSVQAYGNETRRTTVETSGRSMMLERWHLCVELTEQKGYIIDGEQSIGQRYENPNEDSYTPYNLFSACIYLANSVQGYYLLRFRMSSDTLPACRFA